jgi:hypothetical protein
MLICSFSTKLACARQSLSYAGNVCGPTHSIQRTIQGRSPRIKEEHRCPTPSKRRYHGHLPAPYIRAAYPASTIALLSHPYPVRTHPLTSYKISGAVLAVRSSSSTRRVSRYRHSPLAECRTTIQSSVPRCPACACRHTPGRTILWRSFLTP